MKRDITPLLSIVIPAYREELRIGRTLDELSIFLTQDEFFKDKPIEVIVVVANTVDQTAKMVESYNDSFNNLRLLRPGQHVGKGRDVQFGVCRAKGKYVIFMDADLATPLHHLKVFLRLCENGSDIVIGVRNLYTYRGNRLRGFVTVAGNLIYRLTGGLQVGDTQCGFKMFNKVAADICFSKLTIMGWDFDMEVLAIAKANDLHIHSVKISDWKDMPFSTHNDNPVRISFRMLFDHVKITFNLLSGKYKSDPANKTTIF